MRNLIFFLYVFSFFNSVSVPAYQDFPKECREKLKSPQFGLDFWSSNNDIKAHLRQLELSEPRAKDVIQVGVPLVKAKSSILSVMEQPVEYEITNILTDFTGDHEPGKDNFVAADGCVYKAKKILRVSNPDFVGEYEFCYDPIKAKRKTFFLKLCTILTGDLLETRYAKACASFDVLRGALVHPVDPTPVFKTNAEIFPKVKPETWISLQKNHKVFFECLSWDLNFPGVKFELPKPSPKQASKPRL